MNARRDAGRQLLSSRFREKATAPKGWVMAIGCLSLLFAGSPSHTLAAEVSTNVAGLSYTNASGVTTNTGDTLSPDEEAEQAWKETEKALRPPMRSSQLTRPTPEERAAIVAENARYAGAAMAKARDFYTRFPNHPKAPVA